MVSTPQTPIQQYTYPDGTKSSIRPVDGQIFQEWGVNQNPLRTWMYDDMKGNWYDITLNHKSPPIQWGNVTLNPVPPAFHSKDDLEEFDRLISEGSACECGAEKVGSSVHSNWCRKS